MDGQKFIVGMHPHGIIPFHALLWAAYCDQYLTCEIDDDGADDVDDAGGKKQKATKPHKMYGFGATADVVLYLPFLRNLMGWLTAGGVSYKTLRDGIQDGKSLAANRNGRKPRSLYIFPG